MFCTKEKQAIIEYGFGAELSKIYLARKTPVEVKAGWGMPPSVYPPNSTSIKFAEVWESTIGGGVFAFKHNYAFGWEVPENHPIEGLGIRAYYLSPGRGLEPPSISYGSFRRGDQFFEGEQYYQQLRNIREEQLFGGTAEKPGLGYIEIWLNGALAYKDFGKGQTWYKIRCGNGCTEGEEIQITEVASYPGHFCFSEDEMRRLRGEENAVKKAEGNIDSYLKQLNAENDALRKQIERLK